LGSFGAALVPSGAHARSGLRRHPARRRRIGVAWALALAGLSGLFATACSGQVSHTAPDPKRPARICPGSPRYSSCEGSPELDVDEACRRGADAYCQKQYECNLQPSSALDACRRHFFAECRSQAGDAKKRDGFDGKAAACCFKHMTEGTCFGSVTNFVGARDPACLAMYRGRGEVGAPCEGSLDCAPSTYCSVDFARSCPGTCAPYSLPGESCSAGKLCEPDATCVAGTCRSNACLGEPCEGADSPYCALGLVCLGASGSRTCHERASLGQACDEATLLCDLSLTCAFADVPGTGTCQERGALGARCWSDANCQTDYVCAGADWSSKHAGSCQSPAQPGMPCTASADEPNPCHARVPLSCRSQSSTCEPNPRLGDACDPATDGCFWSTCEATTRRCEWRRLPGEDCTVGDQCAGLSSCVDGKCEGGSCSSTL
jgi:hypothetical protein